MSEPTPERIRGQLGYLFDDDPDLADASDEELADRLDAQDRAARARAELPLESDAVVRERAATLDRRVTPELVAAARQGM